MIGVLPWHWAAVVAIGAALWGHGYVTGLRHESGRHAEFVTRIAAAATTQAAKAAATIRRQTEITRQMEEAHAPRADTLRHLYGPSRPADRLRQPAHFTGVSLPAIPIPAAKPDAAAADAVSDPAVAAPDAPDACAGLRADAAVTALMLLDLQSWVEQQSVASQ